MNIKKLVLRINHTITIRLRSKVTMASGNLSMLKSESETKAFCGVRVCLATIT